MIKPFGVKKTDFKEFSKALYGKMEELQKDGNTIKEIKYSSMLLRKSLSSPITGVSTDPSIEYSAIILYDDNKE